MIRCGFCFFKGRSCRPRPRLNVVFENTDGLEIKRQDLLLRGPCEFVESHQSGVLLVAWAGLEADGWSVELARRRGIRDELLEV